MTREFDLIRVVKEQNGSCLFSAEKMGFYAPGTGFVSQKQYDGIKIKARAPPGL